MGLTPEIMPDDTDRRFPAGKNNALVADTKTKWQPSIPFSEGLVRLELDPAEDRSIGARQTHVVTV